MIDYSKIKVNFHFPVSKEDTQELMADVLIRLALIPKIEKEYGAERVPEILELIKEKAQQLDEDKLKKEA